jgi:effector-binding domain-containing protein
MTRSVILFALILVIASVFFIPVNQQETIPVNSPFLTVYRELTNPSDWQKWVPELKKATLTDSDRIVIKKDSNSFIINYAGVRINARYHSGVYEVNEKNNSRPITYSYTTFPDKQPAKTIVIVNKTSSLFTYLVGKAGNYNFSDTHIGDFKSFIEIDSLHYGYKIFKNKVPEANLIVIRKAVPAKNKFNEAARMHQVLLQYIRVNNIKQVQPLIAQFIAKGADSVQVNVGLFIDREVPEQGEIMFVHMPKGGPLYSARYYGIFSKRQKVYNGLQQYFVDHIYQTAILPFETYLDDKLPVNDSDCIKIQLNFSAFY